MRPPLLAGLLGSLLVVFSAQAVAGESPWSASFAAGPVAVQAPALGGDLDDGEFAVRAGLGRKMLPAWEGGIEAGYIRFGQTQGGVLSSSSEGRLDSYDLTLFARCHPKVGGHPYFLAGTGGYAVNEYSRDESSSRLTYQVRPAITVGAGLHGLLVPALGFELRWLTIFEGSGPRGGSKRDVLNLLFTLTKE